VRKICGILALGLAITLSLTEFGGPDGLRLVAEAQGSNDPPALDLSFEGVGDGFACVPPELCPPSGRFVPAGSPPDPNGDAGTEVRGRRSDSGFDLSLP
jgi:hypothetical protein